MLNAESIKTKASISNSTHNTPTDVINDSNINLHLSTVLQAIKNLKHTYNPGPDGIPAAVYKKCNTMLGSLLLKLYHISINSCSFPDTWKLAHITPIPKKGNRANATNYRGISILCASSKIFESIVHSHVLFIARNCIIPQQHGFFPKRSTLTNLISLTSVITSSDLSRKI